jgi:pyruvate dehydrogenase E1 component beta subunit
MSFDVPEAGGRGEVERNTTGAPFGSAVVRRAGEEVTLVSVAVGVHRALAAAEASGASCEVIDLRSLRPLDIDTVVASVRKTGRVVVVDEDYRELGLSGEIAAICLEAGLAPRFARVCVEDTMPYARPLEDAALPNVPRILAAIERVRAKN